MKYYLNRAYRRDINYVSRALDVMEHLKKTNLPEVAKKQYEIMQELKAKQGSFQELYPLIAEYKRLFDQERHEVEHIKHHLHELQVLSEAKEKEVKKVLGHLMHHCKHDHGHHHERQLEEGKAVSNYLVMVCGLSNIIIMGLMVVGAACLSLGYSVTLVWIAQSIVGFVDNVVDLTMTGAAGIMGYDELKKKVSEVKQAESKARSQYTHIASLFL